MHEEVEVWAMVEVEVVQYMEEWESWWEISIPGGTGRV